MYQDLALCDNLDVVANLFLGGRVADRRADPRRAGHGAEPVELLDSLGVTSIASVRGASAAPAASASRWRSRARARRPAPRDPRRAHRGTRREQTAQVLELVLRLRDKGLGVVVISHNLENVYSVADRIVVLCLGRLAASFDRRTTPREEVVAAITGASVRTAA